MVKKKIEKYVRIKYFDYKRLFKFFGIFLLCLVLIHASILMEQHYQEDDYSFNNMMLGIYSGILFISPMAFITFMFLFIIIGFEDFFIKTRYCPVVDVEVEDEN